MLENCDFLGYESPFIWFDLEDGTCVNSFTGELRIDVDVFALGNVWIIKCSTGVFFLPYCYLNSRTFNDLV